MARKVFGPNAGERSATLSIRVTPRAAKNEISQIRPDGTIKIRLSAPPVEGKANAALIEFLAKILGVRSSQIAILAGETSRDKLVSVTGLDADTVQQRIRGSMG